MSVRSNEMKMSSVAGHTIAAAALVAAFGVELLGVPSCSVASDASALALRRVDRLVARGQFAEALPLALDNRARYPTEGAAAWQLARVYEGLGTPGEEAAAWEVYLRQAEPAGDVCLRLSDVYHQLAQPMQVVATVNRCLALDDRQPELLGDLAAAYLELGDRSAAVAALARALAIDPGHPQFRAQLRNLEGVGR
jgi:tetratricopeptide (TPR) repeat protein